MASRIEEQLIWVTVPVEVAKILHDAFEKQRLITNEESLEIAQSMLKLPRFSRRCRGEERCSVNPQYKIA